ncbi:hypothetical protein [Capnocytophaga felis]|nr:hypothetical protein [Capnocytophaga felis]
MKKFLFPMLVLFYINAFGQIKKEQLIDSVLVANTTKTYQEYLAHFKKVDNEYDILLKKTQKDIKRNNHKGTLPAISNRTYSSKEFPMVKIHNGNQSYDLKNLNELTFTQIKKVSFLENPSATALYGSQGQFGIYIIEVK